MTRSLFSPAAVSLAMAAFFIAGSAATAETVKMQVNLSGATEVPANTTKGTGKADVTYDTASKKLDWTLTFSGLTGPATAAHFHGPAEAGKNAGVMVPIPVQGTGPFKGSATLTDAQAAALTEGKMYVNVHTAAHAGGEIRGQVAK